MAAIDNMIEKISDLGLKQDISHEVARMKQQKKFGLVFEEHLPEATPLYDVPIKKKSLVAEKDGFFKVFYRVKRVEGDALICETLDDKHEEISFEKDRMVAVAMFGEPIYPYLKSIDEVLNAPDSKLWHTLIEAENYHALQLLVYLYGGIVDCIYIDPPYNTGDKSWKYNNDYVDSNDSYRHSKWLSMMKKRLVLAKKLLNPKDSVLIVTIDEKEYLRLGCLLEEVFTEENAKGNIQMVSTVTNPKGNRRDNQFSRCEEYIFYVFIGDHSISSIGNDMLRPLEQKGKITKTDVRWRALLRSAGNHGRRRDRKDLFYPLLFDSKTGKFVGTGPILKLEEDRNSYIPPKGQTSMWPIGQNGEELTWNLKPKTLQRKLDKHILSFGKWDGEKRVGYYLSSGQEKLFDAGYYDIVGQDEDGAYIIQKKAENKEEIRPLTVWNRTLHSASDYGTTFLNSIIGSGKFDFPKSIYAVHDTIRFVTASKPNALIVDFFAGSGTTMHAINLLNTEDNGKRRCIMVTNNEVSIKEINALKAKGLQPGDEEWERFGVARYVNWPRTKCSIIGQNIDGEPLKGSYQTYLKQEKEKERTIKQITLIDDPSSMKTAQKKELVALCCQGKLPQSLVKADTKFIVSEDHPCTILFEINYAEEWLEALEDQDQITEFYIVTRNNKAFKKLKADIQELLGNIIEEEPVSRPMSEGFAANAKYFKLGFLDKDSVELQRQFRELLPLLWMKAGAIGRCPEVEGNEIPEMMLLEDNSMAILTDEEAYVEFRKMMDNCKNIKSIFIVTNSEDAFMSMAKPFCWAQCYQLYKDYLENFSINHVRR